MTRAEGAGHLDSKSMGSKSKLLANLRKVSAGRVVTYEALGQALSISPRHVETLLGNLSEDEREMVPWHRAVAKGGAIGRGPNRDQQFAKLVREGVAVSPAGIVQDMARVTIKDLSALPPSVTKRPDAAPSPAPASLSRSRGMKDRPE